MMKDKEFNAAVKVEWDRICEEHPLMKDVSDSDKQMWKVLFGMGFANGALYGAKTMAATFEKALDVQR